MAGHGGARPGAGAPKGGISQTRRLLLRGIERGFVKYGRLRGLTGSDEEVIVETVAHAASDLLGAGQVREVLAIWAQAAPKGDDPDDPGKKSPLLRALERMPGLGSVPDSSQPALAPAQNRAESAENQPAPTDPASVTLHEQPFFSPQRTLLPPSILDAAHPLPSSPDPARAPLVRAPGGGGGGTPYPPSAAPPGFIPLGTGNFEKKSEDSA